MIIEQQGDEEGSAMPTYEFRCEKCETEFTKILSFAEHEEIKVACPECKSKKAVQILSVFNAQTSRKS